MDVIYHAYYTHGFGRWRNRASLHLSSILDVNEHTTRSQSQFFNKILALRLVIYLQKSLMIPNLAWVWWSLDSSKNLSFLLSFGSTTMHFCGSIRFKTIPKFWSITTLSLDFSSLWKSGKYSQLYEAKIYNTQHSIE